MKLIKLFEEFNQHMDFFNDIKNHLSQFSFLKYSVKEEGSSLILTFNKDVTFKYIIGLLSGFNFQILNKMPVKLKITSKKEEKSEEFEEKTIIGTIEKIDLPELGLKGIEAKIDSGASASSLHATNIKISNNTVEFTPLDKTYKEFQNKIIKLPIVEIVTVQNSFGTEENRPLIKTTINIGNKTIEIFLSLTNREKLEYPILIGKDVLCNFLVDSSK